MIRYRAIFVGAAALLTAVAAPPAASAAVNAWVVDPAGPRVVRVDTGTGASQSISFGGKLKDPRAITVAADGDLLVADSGGYFSDGALLRIDRDTGAQTVLFSGDPFRDPSGVAELPDGDVLVTDSSKDALYRIDPACGTETKVTSNNHFRRPSGVALAPDGAYLVIDSDGPGWDDKGSLIRVDPGSKTQTMILGGGNFQQPTQIAVRGSDVFVADSEAPSSDGGVYRVPLSAPAFNGVSSSGYFLDPMGIAVEGADSLLVADRSALDWRGAVIRVNTVNGRQTVLSNSLLFSDPTAIAVEPDANANGVADFSETTATSTATCATSAPAVPAGPDTPTTSDPAPAPAPASAPAAAPAEKLPEPVVGRAVNLTGVRGEVTVKLPGSGYERRLDEDQQVPVGATVDVTAGSIKLVTAAPGGQTQQARFSDGEFKLSQSRSNGGQTELKLVGERLACGQATASAKRKRSRRLWGDGHGRFKVRGRNAAAVVRGTKWLVEDRCAGTLVKVTRGKVAVRDRVARKTVIVARGQQHFARNAR